MRLIRLPLGDEEPEGEDTLQMNLLPSGTYEFVGSIGFAAGDIVPGSETNAGARFMQEGGFKSAAEAEAAALAWAEQHGAATIYLLPAA